MPTKPAFCDGLIGWLLFAVANLMVDLVARKDVRVANPLGLHIRPAYLFARLASRYESVIEVVKDGQSVNGKSVLEILMLAATQGTILTIVARGHDADRAMQALVQVIEQETPADDEPLPLADASGDAAAAQGDGM